MVDLTDKTPFGDTLPLVIGSVSFSEVAISEMVSIAPFSAKEQATSQALEAVCGVAFPKPGQSLTKAGARITWLGQGRALLQGIAAPDLAGLAAVTEQSDGWAILRMEGEDCEAVLARLVPIDLRAGQFKRGKSARTLVNHMQATITRIGKISFEIMVMRSMAQTLVAELSEAAERVAAGSEV